MSLGILLYIASDTIVTLAPVSTMNLVSCPHTLMGRYGERPDCCACRPMFTTVSHCTGGWTTSWPSEVVPLSFPGDGPFVAWP